MPPKIERYWAIARREGLLALEGTYEKERVKWPKLFWFPYIYYRVTTYIPEWQKENSDYQKAEIKRRKSYGRKLAYEEFGRQLNSLFYKFVKRPFRSSVAGFLNWINIKPDSFQSAYFTHYGYWKNDRGYYPYFRFPLRVDPIPLRSVSLAPEALINERQYPQSIERGK